MRSINKKQVFTEIGKIPPQSLELEEAVIGSILLESKSLEKIIDFIKPEMFYKEAHQLFFKSILNLYATDTPIDTLTLYENLKKTGNAESVGGAFAIIKLTNKISSSANIEYHARIIQQKYIQRELIRISNKTIVKAYEDTTDPLELLSKISEDINNISEENFKENDEIKPDKIEFPLHCVPDFMQSFINNAANSENFSKDFLCVSFFSAYASIVGNKLKCKYKNSWTTSPILWFVIVGNPGSKKSHPVKLMLKPLKDIDKRNREKYESENEFYQNYIELDKTEKQNNDKIDKPVDEQIIIKNTTIEALFHAHKENPAGLLYYRDEIGGWVDSMNQYKRNGDDMPIWLSMFDGDDIVVNRVGKERLYLEETNINLIGTTQPSQIHKIPTDNGLLHRLLFTNADNNISELKFATDIDINKINEYSKRMISIYESYSNNDFIKIYNLDEEAQSISLTIDKYLVSVQKNENENPLIKEYCEKLKTYIPRFEVLLADMDAMFNNDSFGLMITKKHAINTFDLIKYFLNTARNLFNDQKERKKATDISKSFKFNTEKEKAIKMIKDGVSVTQIANELSLSRPTIYKYKRNAKI